MKTVGDLVGLGFPLLWHEAVAVVQEVASHVSPDRGIPADGDLLFNDDGTISLTASGGRVSLVPALARLLQRLLPEDAPAALHALASENSGEQPTHPTLEAFTAALAFFERPGRAGHLLGVATRLQNYTPPASTEEELVRLRKKVIDAPEEPAAAPTATRLSIHPAYAAGGAALAIVAVMATARLPVGPLVTALSNLSSRAMAPGSSTVASSATPDATDGKDAADKPAASGDASDRDTRLPASHPNAANRRLSVSPGAVSAGAAIRPAAVAPADGPHVVATLPDVSDGPRAQPSMVPPAAAPAAARRDTPFRVDRTKVYSSEDTGVTPAALVRPQLPTEPKPGPNTGLFDLTVDESGHVVSVRLLSPAGRFEERSLVSAAKAWRFRPALLDGHPVKYRLRVPINVPGQQ